MRRYLLVALLPAGLAAIAAATVLAVRREPASPAMAADEPAGPEGPAVAKPPDAAARVQPASSPRPDIVRRQPRGARSFAAAKGTSYAAAKGTSFAAAKGTGPGRLFESAPVGPDWLLGLIKLGAIGSVGGIASYRIMASLAPPVVNHGPAIDEPIFRWAESHQVDWWAAIMRRLNTVGNVWTTWGAVGSAAACLGVSWRKQRWLPPAALGLALLVDHHATLKLHRTIRRPGPPTNPLGTYPAGGPDRVVLFSGVIAHLLWREFSGSRRGRIWGIGAVAALAFGQAYTRAYLGQHWFVDVICGLLYGVLLLTPFIAAIRFVAGPVALEARRAALCSPATPARGHAVPQLADG